MPHAVRSDALRVRNRATRTKEKPRIQGDPRLPKLTVAGGFGGSGDDQSGLVERSERGRGEESQCGGDAEELGHLRAPLLALRCCLNS
mgnify:CR=1 FL=1